MLSTHWVFWHVFPLGQAVQSPPQPSASPQTFPAQLLVQSGLFFFFYFFRFFFLALASSASHPSSAKSAQAPSERAKRRRDQSVPAKLRVSLSKRRSSMAHLSVGQMGGCREIRAPASSPRKPLRFDTFTVLTDEAGATRELWVGA
ncbi:MAG: hypothetical protein ACRDJC_12885 [Thermomicrobiales bacterium]